MKKNTKTVLSRLWKSGRLPAVIGLITLFALLFQSYEIRQSNELTRIALEQNESQLKIWQQMQRAYLTTSYTFAETPNKIDIELGMTWANTGTSLATEAVLLSNLVRPESSSADVFDECISEIRNGEDVRQFVAQAYFGPGESRSTPSILPRKLVQELAQNDLPMTACGIAMYRDIIPHSPVRLSSACFILNNWSVNPDTGAFSLLVNPCSSGNCIDDNCPDYGSWVSRYSDLLLDR